MELLYPQLLHRRPKALHLMTRVSSIRLPHIRPCPAQLSPLLASMQPRHTRKRTEFVGFRIRSQTLNVTISKLPIGRMIILGPISLTELVFRRTGIKTLLCYTGHSSVALPINRLPITIPVLFFKHRRMAVRKRCRKELVYRTAYSLFAVNIIGDVAKHVIHGYLSQS